MAENDNKVVYLRVHLHYNGVFVRHPSGYVGGNYFLFTDVDWAGMDVRDFFAFLDRAIGEEFQNLYYCLPNIPLSRGIYPIVDDLDFAQFIDTGVPQANVHPRTKNVDKSTTTHQSSVVYDGAVNHRRLNSTPSKFERPFKIYTTKLSCLISEI
ncbi:unnamed protein product [Lactuca virosa]|uniref:Uncharacterized protein n=1 Tax=Lactuca virosa TaxID=75947 RepID=A0AAU9NHQ0_9ASTR|nr:unnamed protein product [Lactuca virosa]